MAARLAFAVPGDIEARTGGTIYDRRVMEGLRAMGWAVNLLSWPDGFPFPTAEDRAKAAASLAALPDGALVMIDGLAFGVLAEELRVQAERLRLVALVHHPLALETGLPAQDQEQLVRSERAALSFARVVIVTSDTTANILERDYAVPRARLAVVSPGVDRPDRRAAGPRRPGPIRLFALGSLTPRKAHHRLIEALARMTDLDWRLTIAGSDGLAPQTAAALRRQVVDLGLSGRVDLVGRVDDEAAAGLYADADIFVLASFYEGYGMVFAEAQGWGLPVVATTGGAIPEAVGPDAGILVEPDNAAAFGGAVRSLIEDPVRRATLAAGARRAAEGLPSWSDVAAQVARVLGRL